MTMETTLLLITVLSLTLAAIMGVMLMRTLREERRRSDARVALLQDLARGEEVPPAAISPLRPGRYDEPWLDPPRSSAATDLDLDLLQDPSPDPVATRIFAAEPAASPWRSRLVIAGVLAAVALFTAIGLGVTTSPGVEPTAATSAAAERPLELLTLEHSNDPGVLTIKGLVQNPRGAPPRSNVVATVQVLDATGTVVSSGRAPLDFSTLGGGDESPFVVRVPIQGSAARYRVGFRRGDDRVVGHIDRRDADASARKQVP